MKKVFLYIVIGIILLAIPLTVFLVGQNQEVRKRAAPATTLSLTPASVTTKVNETFTLEVKIDTGVNQVSTAQIHVLYDPTKLTTESITNGPLAPSIQVSGNINPNGVASITVGAQDTTHPINGIGTIAVLTMRGLTANATPVAVRFAPNPDTFVNAIGETAGVLVGESPANVTILNADGTQATTDTANLSNTNSDASQSATNTALTPSSSLPPSPTPTEAASFADASASAQASSSAVTITSISQNETITTSQPPIEGKGMPGTTVTLIIHSTPQTVTVTVDGNGNWTYTPTTPLDPGTHTVEAMVTDPNTGQTQTTTASFVIAPSATGGSTDTSTPSAMPVTGTVENTILLVIIGSVLLVSGAILPLFIQ